MTNNNEKTNKTSKTRKIFLSSACALLALAAVGFGAINSNSAGAANGAIGKPAAEKYALADAGINASQAKFQSTELDYERGQYVYEVEFTANGTEYDYVIKADDGTVISRESEPADQKQTGKTTETEQKGLIGLQAAKEKALADAKVKAAKATFTTAHLDSDDGLQIYDIEFQTADKEYDYEINAKNGAIIDKSIEALDSDDKVVTDKSTAKDQSSSSSSKASSGKTTASDSTSQSDVIGLSAAKTKALNDAGVAAADATFTSAHLDRDDGVQVYDIEFYTSSKEYDYEINATSGAIREKSIEALEKDDIDYPDTDDDYDYDDDNDDSDYDDDDNAGGAADNSDSYIGTSQAQSIALGHAGLSASQVTFTGTEMDYDDGRTVYEVDFYANGIEYEYTIDAVSGSILEYDSERDDD